MDYFINFYIFEFIHILVYKHIFVARLFYIKTFDYALDMIELQVNCLVIVLEEYFIL